MAMDSTALVRFPGNKGGRPPHIPTEQSRERVREMAAAGARLIDIAVDLDISDQTVLKYYHDDFRRARVKAYAKMGKSIYDRGIAGEAWAATLYAKTQMGWTDRPQQIEVTNTNNLDLNVPMSPKEALDAFMEMLHSSGRNE
jgi:hypothetical protein